MQNRCISTPETARCRGRQIVWMLRFVDRREKEDEPDARVLLFRIRFVSFAVRLRQGSALFAPPGPALCGGLSRGPPHRPAFCGEMGRAVDPPCAIMSAGLYAKKPCRRHRRLGRALVKNIRSGGLIRGGLTIQPAGQPVRQKRERSGPLIQQPGVECKIVKRASSLSRPGTGASRWQITSFIPGWSSAIRARLQG